MSLPTPRDVDAHVSRALLEAKSQLQRAFAEGVGTVRDFPDTLKQLQELDKVLDMEEAVETASSIRERLQEAKEESAGAHSHQLGKGQRVAVFLDGSSTSYAALRWALRAVVSPQDDLYLVNIMPYDEFLEDAEHLLQQGYDYAHHAGVRCSILNDMRRPHEVQFLAY